MLNLSHCFLKKLFKLIDGVTCTVWTLFLDLSSRTIYFTFHSNIKFFIYQIKKWILVQACILYNPLVIRPIDETWTTTEI